MNNKSNCQLLCLSKWVALMLLLFIGTISFGQRNKIPKSEIPVEEEAYRDLVKKGLNKEAINQLKKLKSAYSDNFMWDSLNITYKKLSALGLEVGDMQTHVEGEFGWISFQRMMKGTLDSLEERMTYLIDILATNDISIETQCNVVFGMGRMYRDRNMLDSSEVWYAKAVKLTELTDEHEAFRTMYRINWAEVLWQLNKTNKAINVLFDAEKESEKMEKKHFPQMRIYDVLGKIFNSINDFDKAEYYYRKSMRIGEENDLPTYYNVSRLLLGELLTKHQKIEEGRLLLNLCKSYINKKKVAVHIPALYSTLASGYLKQKDFYNAKLYIDSTVLKMQNLKGVATPILHYENALDYHITRNEWSKASELINELEADKDRVDDFVKIHGLKYKYYKSVGDNAKALFHFERFDKLQDSVKTRNQVLQIQRLESEYNREKQDIEISNLSETKIAQDKALAVRNTALLLGSFMILILLGLLYGLYRLYKKNRENQAVLSRQNVQITKALEDNKVLMKEIHHRVKNNLQVISSLLNMQARKVTDDSTKDALNSSKTRVQTMSLLHQKLYRNENLKDVNIDEYIADLVDNIVDTYNVNEDIAITIEVDKLSFDVDVLVPLGLITNELICNALKHAFKSGEKGALFVSLKEISGQLVLEIKDNGVGLSSNELPMKEDSLGVRLIKSFTKRMDGKIEVVSDNGTSVKIFIDKDKLD